MLSVARKGGIFLFCTSCGYKFTGASSICPSCGHDHTGRLRKGRPIIVKGKPRRIPVPKSDQELRNRRPIIVKGKKPGEFCKSCGFDLNGVRICPSCGFDHRVVKTPPVVYVPDAPPTPVSEASSDGSPSVFRSIVKDAAAEEGSGGVSWSSGYDGPWELGLKLKLYLFFLILDLWFLLKDVFRNFSQYVDTFKSKETVTALKILLGIDVGVRFTVAVIAIVLVIFFLRSAKWAILLHAVYSAIASFILLVSAFAYFPVSFFDRGFIGIAIMTLAFLRVYLWIVLVEREKEDGYL